MENVININNTKQNTLEFEMVIEGTRTTDVDCNFVIVAKGMELRFPAMLAEGNQWSVTLPAMKFLERTAYKCYTEVVAEGQYFKPMEGNVNVVGTAEIYTSTPTNKTIESDVKKKKVFEKKEQKREVKRKQSSWRQGEKPISQIAEELMEQEKYSKDSIEKKVSEKKKANESVDKDKDAKVKEILKETVKKPAAKKPNVSAKKLNEDTKKKVVEKKADVIAKKLMEDEKYSKEAIEKKVEEKKTKTNEAVVDTAKDDKVKQILKESGIEPKKKKKTKVSFVRTRPLDS